MDSKSRCVLVVGATGSGKSSLINLLCSQQKAPVSDGVRGCTFKCEDYETKLEGVDYFLTDTVGFDEPKDGGTVSHENAIKNLVKFAKQHQDGFNLILFVMKKDRIKNSFVETYNFFYEVLFSEEVPCILYISGTEVEDDIGSWLQNEKSQFTQKFRFKEIICGTAKVSQKPALEAAFAPQRTTTYNQVWLAIKNRSRLEPFQMTTGLAFWAKALNAVYFFFSFGGTYFQPKVQKELEGKLREMKVKEETIKEILNMIAE